MQHRAGRALIGNLAFDAFGHQLERVLDLGLEIAVAEPRAMAPRLPMPR